MIEANSATDKDDIPIDLDEEDDEDPDCLVVLLSKEEYLALCRPWRNALIIKVLGRRVGFTIINSRIIHLWKPKGQIIMTDVGNNFYVIRTSTKEDYETALFGGLWLISEHYLTVQR